MTLRSSYFPEARPAATKNGLIEEPGSKMPVPALDDALRAVLPGEPVIESELEALLSGVVDVRESEQVPAHLARRVIAAILARGVHARDAEGLDALGFRGLAMAREVEELAI